MIKVKKKLIIYFLIILVLTISSCSKDNNYKRLRIIAESNEQIDINNKTLIKDIIKGQFEKENLSYETLKVDNLKQILAKNLNRELYSKIKIEKCISYYPAKSYKNKMIPSGNYETILITIGKAEGNNFWTLLYPEYFGYEFEENNEIEYRSYFYDLLN